MQMATAAQSTHSCPPNSSQLSLSSQWAGAATPSGGPLGGDTIVATVFRLCQAARKGFALKSLCSQCYLPVKVSRPLSSFLNDTEKWPLCQVGR